MLPCVTQHVALMGANSDGVPVWFAPSAFPGTGSCWEQVQLHGPLGQVGELVSALGRRTCLAAKELREAVAAAAEGWWGRRTGRSVARLAAVVDYALYLCESSVTTLCQQQVMGKYPQGVGLSGVHGGAHERTGRGPAAEKGGSGAGAGAAAVRDAGPSGQPEGGPAAAAGAAVGAGAGAGGRPHGQPERYAVRSSIAMAELLPALSQGVQVCAELLGMGKGQGGGRGGGREGLDAWGDAGVDADTSMHTLRCAVTCSVPTLFCASLAMAKHAAAVVEEQQQQDMAAAAAAPGRCCNGDDVDAGHGDSGASGSGGAAGGDGAAGGRVDGGDCPWRQLLLRDVRLMELLGAALKLFARGAAAAKLPGARDLWHKLATLHDALVHTLWLAACTFPVEFCSAVDRKGAAAARPEARTAAAAAAAGRGSSGHGGGSPPCMAQAAIEAILETDDQRVLVACVLEGEAPLASTGMAWDVAQTCLEQYGIPRDNVPEALRALLPPAEARAAVAAAAISAAATGI